MLHSTCFIHDVPKECQGVDLGFSKSLTTTTANEGMYAIGGSANPTILSQGNRYVAPDDGLPKDLRGRRRVEELELEING
ncbi:hypothetical protein Tco_1459632 [Tanacetum coccineum]